MCDEEIDIDILDVDEAIPLPPTVVPTSTTSVTKRKRKQPNTNSNSKRQPTQKKVKIALNPADVDSMPISEWMQQTWSRLSDDVDEPSKSLIESLLAQDQMDIFQASTTTPTKLTHVQQDEVEDAATSNNLNNRQKKRKPSATTVTHSARWSEEEDSLLKRAIQKYGFGSWSTICNEIIKTRTPLQVKNHARHLASIGVIDGKPSSQSDNIASNSTRVKRESSTITVASKTESTEIVSKGHSRSYSNSSSNVEPLSAKQIDIHTDDEEVDIDLDDFVPEPFIATSSAVSATSPALPLLSPPIERNSTEPPEDNNISHSITSIILSRPRSSSLTPQPISSQLHQMQQIQPPSNEIPPFGMTLETKTINVFESTSLPEWFPPYSRGLKTPDRYIRIRSKILSLWNEDNSRYLTKTFVRRELPNEGDVNAISRVHEFLSTYGWINKGLGSKRSTANNKIAGGDDSEHDTDEAISLLISRRKRRVRNHLGEWVDPEDLEGRTIKHIDDEDDGENDEHAYSNAEERRLLARNARYFADTEIEKYDRKMLMRVRNRSRHNHQHNGYDPFTLITFKSLPNDTLPATSPQRVNVSAIVLMIMDIHAHLAQTEIIGLLGGTFDADTKTLNITDVIPCKSDSTDIQCEMDPISELHARTTLAAKSLVVVGWYHSHPTFEPKPSVRDLENQGAYQTLFRHEDGSEPFVGAIVTPYMPSSSSNVSIITWMAVDDRSDDSSFRFPFVLKPNTVSLSPIADEDIVKIQNLVKEYSDRKDRVDLTADYRTEVISKEGTNGVPSITKLDKLMESIVSHFGYEGGDPSFARVKSCFGL